MSKIDIPTNILPDIEIYGGDTTPWRISLVTQYGVRYTTISIEGYTCELTLTPYAASAGRASDATVITPVLKKAGTLTKNSDGSVDIELKLAENDTVNLRGKYTYQIKVLFGTEVRVGQGTLYVRSNIDR